MRYKGVRAEFMMKDNELKILQIIKETPDIQHGRLVEIVEGKKWMVKKTAEDALNRLILQKRIMAIPVANRKHYRLAEYSVGTNVIRERSIVETTPAFIDDMINDMKKRYRKLSMQEKASFALTCMGFVFQSLHEIILYNIESNLKKNRFTRIELEHRQRIKKIMDIMNNDSDRDIIMPWINYKVGIRPMATEEEFSNYAKMIKNEEYYF